MPYIIGGSIGLMSIIVYKYESIKSVFRSISSLIDKNSICNEDYDSYPYDGCDGYDNNNDNSNRNRDNDSDSDNDSDNDSEIVNISPIIDISSLPQSDATDVLPESVEKYLRTIDDQLLTMHNTWKTRPKLCGGMNIGKLEQIPYLAKYGIERYSNAKRLERIIKRYNLDLLRISKKYIYTFTDYMNNNGDEMFEISNNNSIVICQKIEGTVGMWTKINRKQIKQLCIFAIKAQYYHMHRLNYIVDSNGIIHIIDTGYPDVTTLEKAIKSREDYIKNGNGIHVPNGISMQPPFNDPLSEIELSTYSKYRSLTNGAQKWLYKLIAQRERQRIQIKAEFEKCSQQSDQSNVTTKTIYDFLEFDIDLYL
jgi:hypothetical protein